MSLHSNIILSTTSSLEGFKIDKYFGIISSQVVAGTGFLSDFAASFTDLLGGRSGTYQNQLTSLNAEILDSLKAKAHRIGANAVLGTRVDYDEISGKNMMMFMATASGTAVKVQKIGESSKADYGSLSKKELQVLLRTKEILDSLNNNTFNLNTKTWDFVTENQIQEVIPYIFEVIKNPSKFGPITEEFTKRGHEYFSNLPEDIAINALYSGLDIKGEVGEFALGVIKANDLLSLEKMYEKVDSNDPQVSIDALRLLTCEKRYYVKDDLDLLENLSNLIKRKYQPKSNTYLEKGLLSSKEKEVWKCVCGSKNSIEDVYCNSCKLDRYGFHEGQINKDKAIMMITNKYVALKNVFG